MAVDVAELVINPFKEVVERGRDAVNNAEAGQDDDPELARQMGKAGHAVVTEGERALKRLRPLWDAHVEKYGDGFKELIRANDEIAKKRRILEGLLYDFEDFLQPESFEAHKFAELQTATKSFALDSLDIIKRLKIEEPKSTPASPVTRSFPPLPPLPPMRTATQSSRNSRANIKKPAVPDPAAENVQGLSSPSPTGEITPQMAFGVAGALNSAGSRDTRLSGIYRTGTTSSRASSVYTTDGQPPAPRRGASWNSGVTSTPRHPQKQQLDPLQGPLSSTSSPSHLENGPPAPQTFLADRRASIPDVLGDEFPRVRLFSDPKPPSPPLASPPGLNGNGGAAPSRITAWVSDQNDHATLPSQEIQESVSQTQQRYRPGNRDRSIPEQFAVSGDPTLGYSRSERNGASIPYHPRRCQQHERDESHASTGTVFEPTSPATTNRTSVLSDATTSSAGYGVAITANDSRIAPMRIYHSEKEAGSPPGGDGAYIGVGGVGIGMPTLPPVGEHDGLMLAEESRTLSDATRTQVNCAASVTLGNAECMIGPKSTFHQLKGLCGGADIFRKSDMIQGLKVASAYGESTAVSRCTSCEYYHINHEVKLDLEKDSGANFMKAGVVYRLRFLYKSHVTTKNLSEIRYACLFCTQTGQTVREGDAPVFQSQEALRCHLSRHPQPLPRLPGVTVLYGKVPKGSDMEEDYDVYFPDLPASSPAPDTALGMLPAATALKSHLPKYGEKPLADPDGSPDVLRFLVGARIVGVEFPEKWGGKWCVGWHDGVKNSFPLKLVELEAPKQSEVSLEGSNTVMATARWKWSPKDPGRTGWLVFDKGDVIQNIGWLYQDHWCWSGTNSKGKFGVFPSAFMNPSSVKMGQELKRPSTSKGGLFNLRRRSTSTESSYS